MGSITPEFQRSFSAKTKDGTVYQLQVWAPVSQSHTSEGNSRTVGSATIMMADGTILGYQNKSHYHLAETGLEFWSDDPNAP
jgi:hypothetical protein